MKNFLKGYGKLVKHPISLGLLTIVLLVTFWINSQDTGRPRTVVDGDYHQINNSYPTAKFVAEVYGGQIDITLKLDSGEEGDSSAVGTYWVGTFPRPDHPDDKFDVTSVGDVRTMKSSVLGSQDPTKEFHFKDGVITFKFKMMGTTSTVHLSKI